MRKHIWVAAVLTMSLSASLTGFAQSVTIIGEDNPGSSAATRNMLYLGETPK